MRHYRVVTARELARRTAALLDEVQGSGVVLLVNRNGLPAAMVGPVDDAPLQRLFRSSGDATSDDDPLDIDDIDLEELALESFDKDVLLGVSRGLTFDDVVATSGRSVSDVATAFAHLEIRRLVSRGFGTYVPTRLGRRVADALRRTSL